MKLTRRAILPLIAIFILLSLITLLAAKYYSDALSVASSVKIGLKPYAREMEYAKATINNCHDTYFKDKDAIEADKNKAILSHMWLSNCIKESRREQQYPMTIFGSTNWDYFYLRSQLDHTDEISKQTVAQRNLVAAEIEQASQIQLQYGVFLSNNIVDLVKEKQISGLFLRQILEQNYNVAANIHNQAWRVQNFLLVKTFHENMQAALKNGDAAASENLRKNDPAEQEHTRFMAGKDFYVKRVLSQHNLPYIEPEALSFLNKISYKNAKPSVEQYLSLFHEQQNVKMEKPGKTG